MGRQLTNKSITCVRIMERRELQMSHKRFLQLLIQLAVITSKEKLVGTRALNFYYSQLIIR